jgi:hypothetical protein
VVKESEFQKQITDLALATGWQWAHFRPARTEQGWRTPVEGPLGVGFPDLVLLRPATAGRPGRVVFAEIKGSGGKATPEQEAWIAYARAADAECYLWGPDDFEDAVLVLGGELR